MSSTTSTASQTVEAEATHDEAANKAHHCAGDSVSPAEPAQGLGLVFDEKAPTVFEGSKSAVVDGVNVETVIRISTTSKTTFTDESGKDHVVEKTVAQEFEQHEGGDIFDELIKMGWNPRGRPNRPSEPCPPPRPPTRPPPTRPPARPPTRPHRTSNQEDELE